MRRDFTDLAVLLDRNRSGDRNNPPASRRHSRILNADPTALIVTNRCARAGHKPAEINRHHGKPVDPNVVPLAYLDRLLSLPRRGPHRVGRA